MYLCKGVTPDIIFNADRITIKIGSSLLIDQTTGDLNYQWFAKFIEDVSELHKAGKEIVLVSSGAVALGRKALNIAADADKPNKSKAAAAAAVGQISLAHHYQQAMAEYDINVGLILITTDNTDVRSQYLNLRDTLDTLLSVGAIPIVNENDAVSDYDIRYGDNDRLAARIAGMAGADLLLLMSDIDGLYTANPNSDPNAEFISVVPEVTADIEDMAGDVGSNVGTGGMRTKLLAAKIAHSSGCDMIIFNGQKFNPIHKIVTGNARFTHFKAGDNAMNARKHWIIGTPHPAGTVTIDNGAVKALNDGSSLLPIGIVGVKGEFTRGDCIQVENTQGEVIALGLVDYNSEEIFIIMGRQSVHIPKLLGYIRRPELIHRNNMVLV
ncbi:MAG: glutamate 5-kinase [Alphaproteobacteria bacterium]|jgi:glutamate 5-kinase